MPRITWEAEQRGISILQLTMPGCDTLLVMLEPEKAATDVFCAPLVQKLARFMPRVDDAGFVILDGYWNARFRQTNNDPKQAAERLEAGFSELMKTFAGDGSRRMLVLGPLPSFWRSDPFNCLDLARSLGLSQDRCGVPRAVEDAWRADTIAVLKSVVARYPNARLIDPVDLFCDERICMPIKDGTLAFFDDNHVNAYGAKLIFDRFKSDFEWAFKEADRLSRAGPAGRYRVRRRAPRKRRAAAEQGMPSRLRAISTAHSRSPGAITRLPSRAGAARI